MPELSLDFAMDLSERAAIEGQLCRHPWEQARARFVCEVLSELHQDGGSILDIGCGDAYVLAEIHKRFPSSLCLGVDTAFQGQVDCPAGVEIYSESQQLPASVRPASVILLMDVLEHIEDPAELLLSLRTEGLADHRTLLFVAVPAHQFLFSDTDRWLGHHRRYRRRLLRQHLSQAGVEIFGTGYFFLSLLWVRALEVALERLGLRKIQATGLVSWKGGRWLSEALAKLLQLDYRFTRWLQAQLGITLPGLSCYGFGRFR